MPYATTALRHNAMFEVFDAAPRGASTDASAFPRETRGGRGGGGGISRYPLRAANFVSLRFYFAINR